MAMNFTQRYIINVKSHQNDKADPESRGWKLGKDLTGQFLGAPVRFFRCWGRGEEYVGN